MARFYSLSARGFFDSVIHNNIPVDAVEITVAEHAALLVAQAQGKRIEADATGRPVAVDPPLPSAADIWPLIKAKREAIKSGGVKVGTKWYHTDDASRIQYLALLKMAEQALAAGATATTVLQYGGVDIQWKTMDNTFIKMTVQRAQDVFNAVAGLDFASFAAAETHKAAMEASATPSAYDFSTGWPLTFLG